MNLQHAEQIRIDLPARHAYLHLLSECIADMLRLVGSLPDQETLIYNIQLAAHEACTNIVTHAYSNNGGGEGRIQIELTLYPQPLRIEIALSDTGRPFNPESIPSPNLDEVRIHGYGMFLMRSLMDNVSYRSHNGSNHLNLVKHLLGEGS